MRQGGGESLGLGPRRLRDSRCSRSRKPPPGGDFLIPCRSVKLAAIDIGTNSIHLVVVEFDGRTFHVIDREKSMVRLGLGMFGEMRLTERAFNEGVEVLGRYTKLAESRGVEEILAVATSATREAENGTEFLNAISSEHRRACRESSRGRKKRG